MALRSSPRSAGELLGVARQSRCRSDPFRWSQAQGLAKQGDVHRGLSADGTQLEWVIQGAQGALDCGDRWIRRRAVMCRLPREVRCYVDNGIV